MGTLKARIGSFWCWLRSWPHAADASRPRVILTDVGMPELSNMRLKAMTRFPETERKTMQ